MLFQMRQLEAHCRALWTRRLARPGVGQQDVFLLDYLPPTGPGLQPLRPFQRLPCRRVQCDRQGAGGGGVGRVAPPPQVALCARHRAPPCVTCVQRGAEHCCQRAHEGHRMDATQARAYRRYMSRPARSTSSGLTNAAGNRPVARTHTGHADGRASAGNCVASARTSGSQVARCVCHRGQSHRRWTSVSGGPPQ